jgi:hypothetical protein
MPVCLIILTGCGEDCPTSASYGSRVLNRDRGEPHGSSPPTPPGIRITYQAVRSILLPPIKAAGCSVRLTQHSLCSPVTGRHHNKRAGVMSTPQPAYYPSQPFGPSSRSAELLCPLLTSPLRSGPIAQPSASFSRTRHPRAQGRSPGVRHRTFHA